nr:MAG TPA: hypothetical protein [Caudoviricetes sp.]
MLLSCCFYLCNCVFGSLYILTWCKNRCKSGQFGSVPVQQVQNGCN